MRVDFVVNKHEKVNVAKCAAAGCAHGCASDLLKECAVEAEDCVAEDQFSQIKNQAGSVLVDLFGGNVWFEK